VSGNHLHVSTTTELSRRTPRVTISTLPGDALLEIFKFYVDQNYDEDEWHTLVHVCRKWRYVVFAFPRRLRLELRCTNRSPVKKMLDVWPALPIVIDAYITNSWRSGVTNVIAALKRHDLVCRIKFWGVPNWLLKSAVMKKSFPELTDLTLRSNEENAPIIPDLFLGRSAPRLQSFEFRGIPFPFPALGKLLLSATNLVTFRLLDIPNSRYISPELTVTGLSASTRLQELFIDFRSPRPRADRERQIPTKLKRLVLPSLTEFHFKGDSEYLEDIVGRMDAPALDRVSITFFNQLVFRTPLLCNFFSTCKAVFQDPDQADVFFTRSSIDFTLSQGEGILDRRILEVKISSSVPEWQLSSLAQFLSASLPTLPTLERLSIHADSSSQYFPSDMENNQWLELLHPFVNVKDLYISIWVAGRFATALQELTGNTATEVLPALRRIFVDVPSFSATIWDAFAHFITARQFSGHPVTVHAMETARS